MEGHKSVGERVGKRAFNAFPGSPAEEYLKARGIDSDTAREWKAGYWVGPWIAKDKESEPDDEWLTIPVYNISNPALIVGLYGVNLGSYDDRWLGHGGNMANGKAIPLKNIHAAPREPLQILLPMEDRPKSVTGAEIHQQVLDDLQAHREAKATPVILAGPETQITADQWNAMVDADFHRDSQPVLDSDTTGLSPTLIAATKTPFRYRIAVRDVGIIEFESADVAPGGWLSLYRPKLVLGLYQDEVFMYRLDVRVADIQWATEMPELTTQEGATQ